MEHVVHAKPRKAKSSHTCHHHHPPLHLYYHHLHLYHINRLITPMATTYDRHHFTTTQPHYHHDHQHATHHQHQQGPSAGKIMAIMALLPLTGILFGLAGITLVGTVIGLAVATPLFVIFSPVIVPAVIAIGLAVTGFLTSGTFGLTGLSSLSYLFSMVRRSSKSMSVPDQRGKLHDVGEYTGQKTKDLGQKIQHTGHEILSQGQGQGQGQGSGKEGDRGGDRA